MIKYFGDIPKSHLELIKELIDLEIWFDEHMSTISPDMAAKGMTAMSHDYYSMHMEEEGERLLMRTENIYPGYFKSTVHDHTKKDEEYAMLIENLSDSLALDLMKEYGFKNGPLFN